jgi:hypothetical protein
MTANLVALFREAQSVHYRIALTPNEPDCSCTGKNRKLKLALEEQGLATRWRVCTFKWSDVGIPHEVASVPHDANCTHAYLEVLIGKDWKKVDATWEPALGNILPVTEWDGVSDTKIAVPSISTFSPEESAQIIADETKDAIEKDLKVNGAFYAAFNSWLERARQTNKLT